MVDPRKQILINGINAIVPGAYDRLPEIATFEKDKAYRIVGEILQCSCRATHIAIILAGREAFRKLPPAWVVMNVPIIVAQAVDLEDEWDYRRLLEVLKDSKSDLLKTYIAKGLDSKNVDIIEAARDYLPL
jgi:hypothetical protein